MLFILLITSVILFSFRLLDTDLKCQVIGFLEHILFSFVKYKSQRDLLCWSTFWIAIVFVLFWALKQLSLSQRGSCVYFTVFFFLYWLFLILLSFTCIACWSFETTALSVQISKQTTFHSSKLLSQTDYGYGMKNENLFFNDKLVCCFK